MQIIIVLNENGQYSIKEKDLNKMSIWQIGVMIQDMQNNGDPKRIKRTGKDNG